MSEPREILEDAANRYCRWADTGVGSLGPSAMAYEMYSSVCSALAAIDVENDKYASNSTNTMRGELVSDSVIEKLEAKAATAFRKSLNSHGSYEAGIQEGIRRSIVTIEQDPAHTAREKARKVAEISHAPAGGFVSYVAGRWLIWGPERTPAIISFSRDAFDIFLTPEEIPYAYYPVD